ncbi:MAG: hypothetical protein ACOC2L_04220 [Candidatus Sumerlaeota bacterium]
MKIEFTREEFRNLMDMICIAEWIMNSNTVGERKETADYRELEQKIYSHCEEMGVGDLVEKSKELGRFYPTDEYRENGPPMQFIDEYTEDIFWEELINRMAERDAIKMAGSAEAYLEWQIGKQIEILCNLEQKYANAFEKKGLDALILKTSKKRKR